MSVKLMGQVWDLDLNHSQQSILLALADHADDDGSKCFPSVDRIAWKTGYERRQVQRIMRDLEKDNLLVLVAHRSGGRATPTEYCIDVRKGVKKSPFVPRELLSVQLSALGQVVDNSVDKLLTGKKSPAERVTFEPLKGDIFGGKGDIAMSPDPLNLLTSSDLKKDQKKEAASPEPSADFLKAPSADSEKNRQLAPGIKAVADRIYQSDPKKFARLIVWIKQAQKEGFAEPVVVMALERFEPHRGAIDNWYPYLDKLIYKADQDYNRDYHEAQHDERKEEIRALSKMVKLDLVRHA